MTKKATKKTRKTKTSFNGAARGNILLRQCEKFMVKFPVSVNTADAYYLWGASIKAVGEMLQHRAMKAKGYNAIIVEHKNV